MDIKDVLELSEAINGFTRLLDNQEKRINKLHEIVKTQNEIIKVHRERIKRLEEKIQ